MAEKVAARFAAEHAAEQAAAAEAPPPAADVPAEGAGMELEEAGTQPAEEVTAEAAEAEAARRVRRRPGEEDGDTSMGWCAGLRSVTDREMAGRARGESALPVRAQIPTRSPGPPLEAKQADDEGAAAAKDRISMRDAGEGGGDAL